MKHVKLFEQFVNEASYSAEEFVNKYKKAKTLQVSELTNVNYFGVVYSRIEMGRDEKTHAVGSGRHSYLRPFDAENITGIEVLEFDQDLYKEIGVLKKFWKSIQKQGGLIQINIDGTGATDKVISTPEWFEAYSTIK
jgi:hypothetical protein